MTYAKALKGALLCAAIISAGAAQAQSVKHVVLISVDGMHALDVANYIKAKPESALATLAANGVTYTNARTPANSDSFPGLLALITGGSPISHDMFYDVSYDRTYYVNGDTNCAPVLTAANYGLAVGAPGGPGSAIAFDESIDLYVTDPKTGLPVSQNVIDPTQLPYRKDEAGKCVPVYPHDAMTSNTIFGVIKSHGGVTAWADKHPAYDLVRGHNGPQLDDLYTPEITNFNGFDATVSVYCTAQNDQLKVNAILNQINGFGSDGRRLRSVPAVMGMNFQAVSVGQKLVTDNKAGGCEISPLAGQAGGYLDGDGTPGPVLQYGLDFVDGALHSMISALKKAGLYESTLFIVTAKHGQSPINPDKVNKPGHFADLVAGLGSIPGVNLSADDLAAQAILANAAACGSGPCGFVQDDDIALIWLAPGDQANTALVAKLINKYAKQLYVDEVLAGEEITLKFKSPLTDHRTPDILVQPQYGTVYTTSGKKNAEHGGFSFGDTNVGLIVSHPELRASMIKSPVATSQVAVTILKSLGIDPAELDAVRAEHTPALPGLAGEMNE